MAKFVKDSGIIVELSQEDINHLTVVLGDTSQVNVEEDAVKTHGLSRNRVSSNTDLYNFFLKHSDSNKNHN